jgi:hypothetical protein
MFTIILDIIKRKCLPLGRMINTLNNCNFDLMFKFTSIIDKIFYCVSIVRCVPKLLSMKETKNPPPGTIL